MNAQQKFDNVEDMFKEAEDTFRKGVGTLTTWTEQAREVIETKPGVILAAVGISGFVTGTLLRHGFAMRKSIRLGQAITPNTLPGFSSAGELPTDPIVLFVAGIVAGIVAGPKMIEEAISGLHRVNIQNNDNAISLDKARHRSSDSMGEKPFEKL